MVSRRTSIDQQLGSMLLEVLVALVVIAVGLLGLAGLQMKLQASEFEVYQRSQALVMVQDMADRILLNRVNASSYKVAVDSPLGAGMTCPTNVATSTAARDLADWCSSLQGAGESQGSKRLGVLVGGRGCVEEVTSNVYRITVAWQGNRALTSPPVDCARDLYDGDAPCTGDLCRRTVTTVVDVNTLSP